MTPKHPTHVRCSLPPPPTHTPHTPTHTTHLVAAHERKDLGDDRRGRLEAAAELLVEQKAAKLGRARALEELDEDLARVAVDLVGRALERLVAHEVALVVVVAELGRARLELIGRQVRVDLGAEQVLHLVKVAVVVVGVGVLCWGRGRGVGVFGGVRNRETQSSARAPRYPAARSGGRRRVVLGVRCGARSVPSAARAAQCAEIQARARQSHTARRERAASAREGGRGASPPSPPRAEHTPTLTSCRSAA